MSTRKGIILAGGSGTRLHPVTRAVSKHLMPVYDKPMIYYPLSVLMLANIQDVAIITTPHDAEQYESLLGDGSQFGINFEYIVQPFPDGLAQSLILAESFLDGSPSMLVLGDNIHFGHGLPELLMDASKKEEGATLFCYRVADPERYGVIGFDIDGKVDRIIEKPKTPPSPYAVTGLYLLDAKASERAKLIQPSERGELEITSLLEMYLNEGSLDIVTMGRGFAWLDTGTHDSLLDAANFVKTLQRRQGLMVGCPEEIAFQKGWISKEKLTNQYELTKKSKYGQYLGLLLENLKGTVSQ